MKISHFLYNCFLVENQNIKIAIDPGQYLGIFSLKSLIPKSEWAKVTHVLVTHADPDHYWQADRLAMATQAPIICSKDLLLNRNNETQIIGPRSRGIKFISYPGKVITIAPGTEYKSNGLRIEGIKSVHGPIAIKILGRWIRKTPAPDERVGLGSIGFKIQIQGKTILNLGDSIFQNEWEGLKPDVLMLPIGGLGNNTWTLDVHEALEAVKIIKPKLVIPCHYNVPFLWIKNAAPADDQFFKQAVEKLGVACKILKYGEQIAC